MEGRPFLLRVDSALALCNYSLTFRTCRCLDANKSCKIKRQGTHEQTTVIVDITTTTKLVRAAEHDASSTLTALTSEISKLSPMGPPQYQGEVHAVKHLRNAVLGETWANDLLRAVNPQTISFSDFGTNLHWALLLSYELNAITTTRYLGHEGASESYHRASLANTLN
jgi:hypothetical protein